jgi:hypothetical protein
VIDRGVIDGEAIQRGVEIAMLRYFAFQAVQRAARDARISVLLVMSVPARYGHRAGGQGYIVAFPVA